MLGKWNREKLEEKLSSLHLAVTYDKGRGLTVHKGQEGAAGSTTGF